MPHHILGRAGQQGPRKPLHPGWIAVLHATLQQDSLLVATSGQASLHNDMAQGRAACCAVHICADIPGMQGSGLPAGKQIATMEQQGRQR